MSQDSPEKINKEKFQTTIQQEIKSADRTAQGYRIASWFFPVIVAIIGVLVASDLQLSKATNVFIGAISAGLAAFQKGVEPGEKEKFHTKRKRVLEYIEAESTNPMTSFSVTDLKHLKIKSKENPDEALGVFSILYEDRQFKKLLEQKDIEKIPLSDS